jgi:adenylate cyclase
VATHRRLAAIVFTDLVGYTALAQSDERAALGLLEAQDRLVRPLLETHRGRKVKAIGDGLLLEFKNALDAVEFAVAFQQAAGALDQGAGAPPLRVRIGIHLGDVERRGSDILGDAVNVASRIEPLAEPGGICLSAPVYELVHNKVPYAIEKLGRPSLKGLQSPMDVYRVRASVPAPGTPTLRSGPPRLAVLPLANISPDPNDEYFADGLTEELISALSQIRGLRVIARTSVGQYKGTTKPVGQIGSELGVTAVLEGSVRKAGEQLRITVQLIDVPTQEHRWAQTYDRRLENVFAIQAEVAERAAGALRVELLTPERRALGERPTENLAAYESYLRGLEAYHRREMGSSTYVQARRHFDAALREDPEFAAAHAYLANILIGDLGFSAAARDVVPPARGHVEAALRSNPNSSDAHTAAGNLALQVDLDWGRAETEFQRAISLNPSSATAHFWYGFLLITLQRNEEGRAQFEAAVELDPLWVNARTNLMGVLSSLGEFDAAIDLGRRTLATSGWSPIVGGQLAFTFALAGRWEESREAAKAFAEMPGAYSQGLYACLLLWLGEPETARRLRAAWEEHPDREYIPPGVAAMLYAALGDPKKAFDLIELDLSEGDRSLWNYYQSPAFDAYRADPRFLALLRSVHLPTVPPKRFGPTAPAPGTTPRDSVP